jgi:tetratricopeptide (TPR) repeat protein
MEKHKEIEELIELDEDSLLARLYTEITGAEYGGDTFIGSGVYWSLTQCLLSVLWLADNFDTLYKAVCIRWRYCEKREDARFSDITSLAGAVLDAISTIALGVPPFTVAVLLVKLGLDGFCNCEKGIASRDWIDKLVSTWVAKASGTAPGHETYYDAEFYRAWCWLGLKYFQEGKSEEGKDKFETAVKMGGRRAVQDAWLWNEYAWSLAAAGLPNQAVKPAQRGVELKPEDAGHWDTLGWALFNAERLHESIEPLEKAVECDRSQSGQRWYGVEGQLEIRYHLVEAYVASGSPDLAASIVAEMDRIASANEWTAKARTLLAQTGE